MMQGDSGDAREIAPDTSEKSSLPSLKLKMEVLLFWGGLIANNKGKQDSSVPLLSSILLGRSF